jgi:hypothetical protein
VTVPVLLRLLREQLASGRLVGEAELVETGERTLVRDARQLVAYLRERVLLDSETKPDAGANERQRVALRPGEEER